jgi:ABC-type multidrug transport system fused ATPase/permease subunit
MTGATMPPDESRPASVLSKLGPLMGARRDAILILAVLSIASGLTESAVLAIIAQAATSLVSHTTRVHTTLGPVALTTTVGVLLAVAGALAVVRILLQVPMSSIPARIAADVQVQIRQDLFAAFTRASWSVQSRDREGHLQEIMTNQVMQASSGALQAASLITASITFAVLIVSAFALNVGVALVVVAAAALLFGALRPFHIMGARRAAKLSTAQLEYASGLGETARMAEETQVFGVADVQRRRMDRLAVNVQRPSFSTQFLGRLVPGVYQGLIYLMLVGGLLVLDLSGTGQIASLGAVVLLLVRSGTYGQQIQGAHYFVSQATPYIQRLKDVGLRYATSEPIRGNRRLADVHSLAFERVSFAYVRDRPVLLDVDFEVSSGETIGIIGPSGAGKSTTTQLLLRLRDPDDGRYLVNGIPADDFSPMAWQQMFAYVPQEPRLLHTSVADNIRFFREIDDDAIRHAARLAHIHDDIIAWPDGYDTIIGPRADAVSGGQQQRICLARALAGQPEVLVLDEPTSALDPRSESLLQTSLDGLRDAVTMFIVAHRLSTLAICSRVMVIVDGCLEAFEAPSDLPSTSSYYKAASAITAEAMGLVRP